MNLQLKDSFRKPNLLSVSPTFIRKPCYFPKVNDYTQNTKADDQNIRFNKEKPFNEQKHIYGIREKRFLSFNDKSHKLIKNKEEKVENGNTTDRSQYRNHNTNKILNEDNTNKILSEDNTNKILNEDNINELLTMQKQLKEMTLKIKQLTNITRFDNKQPDNTNLRASERKIKQNYIPQKMAFSQKIIHQSQNCPENYPSHQICKRQSFFNQFNSTEFIIGANISENVVNNRKNIKKRKNLSLQEFERGRVLGKGQFGEVCLVRHRFTQFVCALKTISKDQVRKHHLQTQIARQLSIQFYLQHPNITQLYGFFEDHDNFYLIMQFSPNGSLLGLLKKQFRLDQVKAAHILQDVSEGISFIHQANIIHRDIKPQNIMLSFGVGKISDFGWSVYKGDGLRKTASGSPLYYPPQIVLGNYYDQKIDIWDIGVMAYECLIGITPFKIYSQNDLMKIVSDQVIFPSYLDLSVNSKDFIIQSVQKLPTNRITTQQLRKHQFINNQHQHNTILLQQINSLF